VTAVASSIVATLRRSIAGLEPYGAVDGGTSAAVFRLGHPAADSALGAMPAGLLHEVFAATAADQGPATGFAACLAARAIPDRAPVVWIRQDFAAREGGEIQAHGLAALGLDPGRVLLVEGRDARDVLRAAGDALATRGLGAVVVEPWAAPKLLDLTTSRRLALLARENGVTAILLRVGAGPDASAAAIRWSVSAAPSTALQRVPGVESHGPGRPAFRVELLRHRRGVTGAWTMEWDGHDRAFCEPLSLPVAPAAAHRPPAAWQPPHRAAG
jgi:protein ImuA